ncbi:hypothetical protein D3C86_2253230 [compost metagenome]
MIAMARINKILLLINKTPVSAAIFEPGTSAAAARGTISQDPSIKQIIAMPSLKRQPAELGALLS